MKNKFNRLFHSLVIAGLLIILFSGCVEKGVSDLEWYKGNLHTHSYWSDGNDFPESIMDWYKSNGYHFIALSDHNILAEGDFWKSIPDQPVNRKAFEDYLKQYGEDWVNYREDSGRLEVKLKTFREYKPLFEEEGRFLMLQSEEITDRYEDKAIHLNASNIQQLIPPQGGESVIEILQNNINAVLDQKEKTGMPMMVHVAHPNFKYSLTAEDFAALTGERFFEVYNGHPAVHNMGDSLHISVEQMWDLINIAYMEKGQPLIFGLATDDSHHYHRKGLRWANSGRGWIMVKADKLDAESLIESMETGQFYSSTGVSLNTVTYENQLLKVTVNPDPGVEYRILFIGCRRGESFAKVLLESKGPASEFKVNKDISFVRAKVISSRAKENPNYEGEFEVAWTQPVTYSDPG